MATLSSHRPTKAARKAPPKAKSKAKSSARTPKFVERITRAPKAGSKVQKGAEDAMRKNFGLATRAKGSGRALKDNDLNSLSIETRKGRTLK